MAGEGSIEEMQTRLNGWYSEPLLDALSRSFSSIKRSARTSNIAANKWLDHIIQSSSHCIRSKDYIPYMNVIVCRTADCIIKCSYSTGKCYLFHAEKGAQVAFNLL